MTEYGNESVLPFLDSSLPNVARIYDYLLGGKDNFAADRAAAEQLLKVIPDALIACRQNRGFLRRAVRFLAGHAGIGQFIDIGTGLPTQGNVHEIAHEANPQARVVYVDYDPVVVAHAQALLAAHTPTVAAIRGDLRHPEQILENPGLRALIRPGEPVGVLLAAVLHFIDDDDHPYKIADTLMAAMAPGSYLVVSHITPDEVSAETSRQAQAVYADATARAHPRTREQITRFFDGLEIIEPGMVDVGAWRAQPSPGRTLLCGGVARKPSS